MKIREKFKRRLWHEINNGLLLIQFAMFLSVIIIADVYDIYSMPQRQFANIIINVLIIGITALMFRSCVNCTVLDRTTVMFMLLLFSESVYAFSDAIGWIFDELPNFTDVNKIINTVYYFCSIALSWLFWQYISSLLTEKNKKSRYSAIVVHSTAIVATAALMGNIYYGYYFTVSPDGVYIRTDGTYELSLICPTVILAVCVFNIIIQKFDKKTRTILLIYPLLPYAGAIISLNSYGTSIMSILTFFALFFIYGDLFVFREHELVNKERELTETKINSMLLQINPHFIYNTLGSISSLCVEDPKKARDLLQKFSGYLRNNFGEMASKNLIPFDEEIKHLETYIDIEKQRFGDVTFETDFAVTGFEIPALTLQPIVENALKHGIMGRESGGTIKITSEETESNYIITVEDDGVGFEELMKKDGRRHIGVENVKSRLEMLCNGRLYVISAKGIGTVAKIIIPKGYEDNAGIMR